MATRTEVNSVIGNNAGTIKVVHFLNLRAGKEAIPNWTKQRIAEFYLERLQGATSMRSITDASVLALPMPDEKAVEEIYRQNPSELAIEALDTILPVEYVQWYEGCIVPRITINNTGPMKDYWAFLPDEGVKLPSGRLVDVRIVFSAQAGDAVHDSDILSLKQQVKNYLNAKQFYALKEPELPDFTDEKATIPPITKVQYGTCVVDGTPLVAYGVVKNVAHQHDNSLKAEWLWAKSQDEADRAFGAAIGRLEQARRERKNALETKREKEGAKQLKDDVILYYKSYGQNYNIPAGLRERLGDAYYRIGGFWFNESTREQRDAARQVIAELKAIEEAEKVKQARKPNYEKQTKGFTPRAYFWVRHDGSVYAYCGKSPKGGVYDVDNMIGNTFSGEPILKQGDSPIWQQVTVGVELLVREVRPSGKQLSVLGMFKVTVPSGKLPIGVWAASEDSKGKFFYPAIFTTNGEEIVPDLTVVR